jgi:glucose-1-phosphate thymidylyltransferase
MLSGIRDILIISTPADTPRFKELLGDGSKWGLRLEYKIQPHPGGLAQAFIIGRDFVNGDPSALILGDNLFYGHDLVLHLKRATANKTGACIFAYHVQDPHRYGVVEFDSEFNAKGIVEKPKHPASNYAVTGLYFYDEHVCDIAKNVKTSERGELEITDVNKVYLKLNKLKVEILGRGFSWLDTGTHDSLLEASSFIATIQNRQGLMVACPEEIAFNRKWISAAELEKLAAPFLKTNYGNYLNRVLGGKL